MTKEFFGSGVEIGGINCYNGVRIGPAGEKVGSYRNGAGAPEAPDDDMSFPQYGDVYL